MFNDICPDFSFENDDVYMRLIPENQSPVSISQNGQYSYVDHYVELISHYNLNALEVNVLKCQKVDKNLFLVSEVKSFKPSNKKTERRYRKLTKENLTDLNRAILFSLEEKLEEAKKSTKEEIENTYKQEAETNVATEAMESLFDSLLVGEGYRIKPTTFSKYKFNYTSTEF